MNLPKRYPPETYHAFFAPMIECVSNLAASPIRNQLPGSYEAPMPTNSTLRSFTWYFSASAAPGGPNMRKASK